jgi:hypothetical protein
MTEGGPEETETTEPAKQLPGLEPDEFVGGGPAGDADPTGFVSSDQSADPAEAARDTDEQSEDEQ